MYYTDRMLHQWAKDGGITPYNNDFLNVNSVYNPASIDLTLSPKLLLLVRVPLMVDNILQIEKFDQEIELTPNQTMLLEPNMFVLGCSNEYIKMPNNALGFTSLKSTPAREGTGHSYAGLIDPGFEGQITFELYSQVPVILTRSSRICQLVLGQTKEEPYRVYTQTGRYNNQVGPTVARSERSYDEPITKDYDVREQI